MGQKEKDARILEESRLESLLALEERYSSQSRRHAEERVSRIESVQASPTPPQNARCGCRARSNRRDCYTKPLFSACCCRPLVP